MPAKLEQFAKRYSPEDPASLREHLKNALPQDIEHRRRIHLALNEQMANAARELHRTYVLAYMRETSGARRAELASRYLKAREAGAQMRTAGPDEYEGAQSHIFSEQIGPIEEWLADVAGELEREEQAAIAECFSLLGG